MDRYKGCFSLLGLELVNAVIMIRIPFSFHIVKVLTWQFHCALPVF